MKSVFILVTCLKKTFVLSLLLLFCFFQTPITAQENKKRIAVLPFEFSGNITESEAIFLTDKVRTSLIKTHLFEVISNDQLKNMIEIKAQKQGLGAGSCSTEECIIDLGNALECEKMFIGKAAEAFGQYSISGKILDVVTQKYEEAQDINVDDKKSFPDAAKELVKKLTRNYSSGEFIYSGGSDYTGTLWRTAVLPGWGHLHVSQKRGWAYMGLWAVSGGAFLWSHLNYTATENEYAAVPEGSLQSDYDAKFSAYQNAAKTRTYMSYLFLASYAVSFSDLLFTDDLYAAYRKPFAIKIYSYFSNERVHPNCNPSFETGIYLFFQRSLR